MKRISRNEWTFITITTVFLVALTTVPFLYGYFRTPPDRYFLGIHSLAPGDYSVYFSYILQFYEGHFFFRDLFTSESVSYNMLNTYWDAAGALGKVLRLTPFFAFHLARILSIPVLALALYLLVSFFYADIRKRKLLFLFLCFASGIGAYFEFLFLNAQYYGGYYHKPMDLWVAESNIFLSMLHSGHMVLSLALTVFIIYFLLRAFEEGKLRLSITAGIFFLILLSFHPFMFPAVAGIFGLYIIFLTVQRKKICWNESKHFCVVLFFSLPIVVYYIFMLLLDPLTQGRSGQNTAFTSAWYLLFFSYGFLLLFACIGIFHLIQKKAFFDHKNLFLLTWLIAHGMLIFSPINFQRRLSEGLQIPLTFFAIEGILFILYAIKRKKFFVFLNSGVFIMFFTLLFLPSNISAFLSDILLYRKISPITYPQKNLIDPIIWLKALPKDDVVLLALPNISHIVPGIAGKPVYIGHDIETLHYKDKEMRVRLFFLAKQKREKRKTFLKEERITHIFVQNIQKEIGSFYPEKEEYLQKVFGNENEEIYEVIPEKL